MVTCIGWFNSKREARGLETVQAIGIESNNSRTYISNITENIFHIYSSQDSRNECN